jgi:SAM-dependent methyltransferase
MYQLETQPVAQYQVLLKELVSKGGPEPDEYDDLDQAVDSLHAAYSNGMISQSEIAELREALGPALSPSTLQGFAYSKPYGYSGDFEVIDRIYTMRITDEPNLIAWDKFLQEHSAPKAVRNRKSYFHDILDRHASRVEPLRVLNVASGPGRCMYEWLAANSDKDVSFHCVDIDENAIKYASKLNERFSDRITFTHKNALRFRSEQKYDVIWAAGICDYFNDATFQAFLSRLMNMLAPGGELVLGNFSKKNASRAYMELISDWWLHHRTPQDLASLAIGCGVSPNSVFVGSEPEGVNLFLHVTN